MRLALITCAAALLALAAPLPRVKVSDNQRFLVTAGGKPFFYLADTGWELFHRLDRKQAAEYLAIRASQGFNAIQAVALAELDGVTDPNAYGDLPLINKDPRKPAITPGANPANKEAYDYWDHVDYIVDQANLRGIYIALLPSWGRWVNSGRSDESLLTPDNAQSYGEFLGKRYGKKGVIWILGGDRTPTGFEGTWRALARGIAIGVSGKEDYGAVLMSFHPRGGETSSAWFHDDPWLDFNMHQTGHGLAEKVMSWAKIIKDYERTPVKPVVDGEPLYEDHPLAFRAREFGYSSDAHIRQRAYWAVFSGTCGHTYGNHAVWQMYTSARKPVNGPLMHWTDAVKRPGALQMRHLKALVESRPYLSRVPDQSLVVDTLDGADKITATRGDGYAFIYSGQGRKFKVRMGKISGDTVKASWYNPRSGTMDVIDSFPNTGEREFVCPSEGFGSDWVLVLDDSRRSEEWRPRLPVGKRQPDQHAGRAGQQELHPRPPVGTAPGFFFTLVRNIGDAVADAVRQPLKRFDDLLPALAVGDQDRRGVDAVGGFLQFLAETRRDLVHRAVHRRLVADRNEDRRAFDGHAFHSNLPTARRYAELCLRPAPGFVRPNAPASPG